MDICEIIKNRHSVRSYQDKEIETEKVDALQTEIDECNKQSGLHIQLAVNEPKAFKTSILNYGKIKNAKNYIVLVGKKADKALDEKIGYYGERVVLKAQELGLNTCWVALTYNKGAVQAEIDKDEKLVCVISLGYGTTQGNERKSKTPEKVSNIDSESPEWFKKGVEMALLAPTAINQQQFYIERDENRVLIESKIGFYAKIDLGIVKLHFELGAGKENFEWK